ncbi:ABC transporter permease [Thalassospira sp. TSL5-1]|uniref:cell division protein FtsX n=1 Tax=Thalassospira sp. TSL5-1 TaxID=1544451 RepID=UPI00093CD21A|nr:FtsX-like permease family protein [Thalassospira sp. TSL5-1]OKH87800.1 cell division protein [Thalassospira sp. TSL5-1]
MAFRSRPSHLPLENDSSGRFLPSIVALMVALLTFSIVGLAVLHDTVGRWTSQIDGSLTIQVPPTGLTQLDPKDREAALEKRVQSIIDTVSGQPGIARIAELSPDKMAELLEPWLGPNEMISDLPIPRIIEITPKSGFDFSVLEATVSRTAPEAVLDDHRIWLERISDVAVSVEMALVALIGVLFAATVLSVFFATRSGLSIHRSIIELLHLIGAADSYIAKQFARHSMRLAFLGSLIGIAIALPVSIMIGYLGLRAGWQIPDNLHLPLFFILVLMVPVAISAVAWLTAKRTVLRVLRKML